MRIAICFSGHLRSFEKCYSNIQEKLLTPLSSEHDIDIFISGWDSCGHRSDNFKGKSDWDLVISKLQPKMVKIQKSDRDFFIRNFASQQWKCRPSLSVATTSGDAVSMWYQVYQSWKLVQEYEEFHSFEYDFVIRTRPDLLFSDTFDLKWLNLNGIVMTEWHGKYFPVTLGMMDQFAFGKRKDMKKYMELYLSIRKYLDSKQNIIHTGEGFLYHHLMTEKMYISRIPFRYSLQRLNSIDNLF